MTRRMSFLFALFAALLPAAAPAAPLDGLPGVEAAADLELAEEFLFEFDGEVLAGAEIYFSPAELFYLVVHPRYEQAVMISPRGRSVQSVDKGRFAPRGEIGGELAEGAALELIGRYVKGRHDYVFELDGKTARLLPRPPALGFQDLDSLGERHRRYAAHAAQRPAMAPLKAAPMREGEVLVRVFFGSWEPMSARVVPKLMAFEQELRRPGQPLRFEYYGLPERFTEDELAAEAGIYGLPAAIVYVDGDEVGRLRAFELDQPQQHLAALLFP